MSKKTLNEADVLAKYGVQLTEDAVLRKYGVQAEPPAPTAIAAPPVPEQEQGGIVEGAVQGLKSWIPAAGYYAGKRLVTGEKQVDPQLSTAGKVAEFLVGAADPSAFLFLPVAALAKGKKVLDAAKLVKTMQAGRALGVAGAGSANVFKQRVGSLVAAQAWEAAKQGAILSGLDAAGRQALYQASHNDEFDPASFALSTGLGVAGGAVIGGGISRFVNRGKPQAAVREFLEPRATTIEKANAAVARAESTLARKAKLVELDQEIFNQSKILQSGRVRLTAVEAEPHLREKIALEAELAQLEKQAPQKRLDGVRKPEAGFEGHLARALDGLDRVSDFPVALKERVRRLAMNQDAIEKAGASGNYSRMEELVPLEQASVKEAANLSKEIKGLAQKASKENRAALQDALDVISGQASRKQELLGAHDARLGEVKGRLQELDDLLNQGRAAWPEDLDRANSRLSTAGENKSFVQQIDAQARKQVGVRDQFLDFEAKADAFDKKYQAAIQDARKSGRVDVADLLERKRDSITTRVLQYQANPNRYVRDANGQWRLAPVIQQRVFNDGPVEKFLNQTTRFSKVDARFKDLRTVETLMEVGEREALKTRLFNKYAEPVADALEALEKIDRSLVDNFGLYFQHVETGSGGLPAWVPAPEGALRFAPDPGDAAKKILFRLRDIMNAAQKEAGFRFKQGYVPRLKQRIALGRKGDTSLPSRVDVRALHRQGEALNPDVHLLDGRELLNSYFGDHSRYMAFKDVVPKIQRELVKMSSKGLTLETTKFAEVVGESLGAQSRKDLVRFLGDAQLEQLIPPVLRDLEKQAPTFVADLIEFMRRQLYTGSVFWNPKVQLLQWVQPEMVASAEVGAGNVLRAHAGRATPAAKEASGRWIGRLMSADMHEDLLREGGRIDNAVLRTIDRWTEKVSTWPRALFQSAEAKNRKTVFEAAYMQFSGKVKNGLPHELGPLLETLNAGQRGSVTRVLREKGVAAAAEQYAAVRSLRSNFMMTMVDKPEYLRKGMGQLIPFTTWPRNAFARMWEDLFSGPDQRNYQQAVMRVAYPLIAAGVLGAVTDTDPFALAQDLVPAASGLTLFQEFNPFPGVSEIVEATESGGPVAGIAAGLKSTAPGRAYKNLVAPTQKYLNGDSDSLLRSFLRYPARQGPPAERINEELIKLQSLFDPYAD